MKSKMIIPGIIAACFLIVFGCFLWDIPNRTSPKKDVQAEKIRHQEELQKMKSDETSLSITLALGTKGSLSDKDYKGAVIYQKPGVFSGGMGYLHYNCCMEADPSLSNKEWIAVKFPNKVGYVSAKDAKLVTLNLVGPEYDITRNGIVKEAVSYLGNDYSKDGKTLNKTNCNTFAQLIYQDNGISIPNSPNAQKEKAKILPEGEALPGDIIYYPVNNGSGHVAIYLGDGFIINSAGHDGFHYPSGGVRICKLKYHDREEYSICRLF